MQRVASRLSRSVGMIALGAALATSLSGCITMPSERPSAGTLPEQWRDAPAAASGGLINWWAGFQDPSLNGLIAEGLAQGPSIQLAVSRVREARAFSYANITTALPQVTAFGTGTYTRANEGPQLPSALGGTQVEQGIATYGAQVDWEIPIFEIQAIGTGANANTRIALADERGAQVALAADIAQAYVDLRTAQQSYKALAESVASADRLASITQISADAGITAQADAADVRRLAESTRAQLPAFAIEARRAETVLSVLRGYAPGADTREAMTIYDAQTGVPSLPISSAPAAPADLVRLRPDVAAAEGRALGAAAQLGVARADLLPRLNLTGSIGVTDNVLGNQLPVGFTRTTGTPLISIPLFDWGQRLAIVRQRDAQFDQSLIAYRQTVLQAVAEATNALSSLDNGAKRLNSARIAEAAAEQTLRGRRAAYDAGLLSLVDLLRAEQQAIDARLTRINSESSQARAGISVYRAFGGGPALTQGARLPARAEAVSGVRP